MARSAAPTLSGVQHFSAPAQCSAPAHSEPGVLYVRFWLSTNPAWRARGLAQTSRFHLPPTLRRRRPRAPCAHLRQPGQQRPNSEGARASRPDRKNLRLPCRKDWLWLAKRALLSWPGRSSRGERLKGKEALPTPLPRGEWRGRGGGGGCRHEPQRRASCRSRTPVSSTTPSSLSSRRPRSARTALAVLPEGVRAASVKAAVIRLSKLGFLKQVRVKRDQPHWLT